METLHTGNTLVDRLDTLVLAALAVLTGLSVLALTGVAAALAFLALWPT